MDRGLQRTEGESAAGCWLHIERPCGVLSGMESIMPEASAAGGSCRNRLRYLTCAVATFMPHVSALRVSNANPAPTPPTARGKCRAEALCACRLSWL